MEKTWYVRNEGPGKCHSLALVTLTIKTVVLTLLFGRHLGISKEACENARGCWFRTPCLTLKECIEKRPQTADVGFSAAFDAFAKDLEITDAGIETECQHTREGEYNWQPTNCCRIAILKSQCLCLI